MSEFLKGSLTADDWARVLREGCYITANLKESIKQVAILLSTVQREQPTAGRWRPCGDYEAVYGTVCYVTLEPRQKYCDRGNWIAKIFLNPTASFQARLRLDLDGQDGWPRYYMDYTRAKLEVEDWLRKRGQW